MHMHKAHGHCMRMRMSLILGWAPISVKRSSVAVSNPPRLAGERKPSIAQKMEMADIPRSCMPTPTEAESNRGIAGGRSTSPCTSFQPLSSASSSFSSIELYL